MRETTRAPCLDGLKDHEERAERMRLPHLFLDMRYTSVCECIGIKSNYRCLLSYLLFIRGNLVALLVQSQLRIGKRAQ